MKSISGAFLRKKICNHEPEFFVSLFMFYALILKIIIVSLDFFSKLNYIEKFARKYVFRKIKKKKIRNNEIGKNCFILTLNFRLNY